MGELSVWARAESVRQRMPAAQLPLQPPLLPPLLLPACLACWHTTLLGTVHERQAGRPLNRPKMASRESKREKQDFAGGWDWPCWPSGRRGCGRHWPTGCPRRSKRVARLEEGKWMGGRREGTLVSHSTAAGRRLAAATIRALPRRCQQPPPIPWQLPSQQASDMCLHDACCSMTTTHGIGCQQSD